MITNSFVVSSCMISTNIGTILTSRTANAWGETTVVPMPVIMVSAYTILLNALMQD